MSVCEEGRSRDMLCSPGRKGACALDGHCVDACCWSWGEVWGIVGFEMLIGALCEGAVLSRDGGGLKDVAGDFCHDGFVKMPLSELNG
jgi:hypothetical protein